LIQEINTKISVLKLSFYLCMTKKTNSLIFRFGFTTLWDNKCVNKKTIANIIQLENIIYQELKKKNLKVLSLVHKVKLINVIVYNDYDILNSLKRQVIIFYKEKLNLYQTAEKFGLSKTLIINVIKKESSIQKIHLFNKVSIVTNSMLIELVYIKYFLTNFFFILLKFFKQILFLKLKLILKSLNILNIKYFNTYKGSFLKTNLKKKLRKIFGLVLINLVIFKLENIIFLLASFFVKVNIQNVLTNKGLFITKNLNKNLKKKNFRLFFYLLFISVNYKKSKLLSDYLVSTIKKSKTHTKLFKSYVTYIELLFSLNLIKFIGFQLRVTGKLNGKLRKSKYHFRLGKVQLQRINVGLSYTMSISYTKFGVFSIKV